MNYGKWQNDKIMNYVNQLCQTSKTMNLYRRELDRIKDDLKEQVSMYEVLKYYGYEPHKKGQWYMLCCPFHSERTPSFGFKYGEKTCKCFSCGKTCDAISFIQEMDSKATSYVDAVYKLAEIGKVSSFDLSSLKNKERISTPKIVYDHAERDIMLKTQGDYRLNPLFYFVCNLFANIYDKAEIKSLFEKYHVGTSMNFRFYRSPNHIDWRVPIFWQVDSFGEVRAGKLMDYYPGTGKRIKINKIIDGKDKECSLITWHYTKIVEEFPTKQDYKLNQCLFGLHLLFNDGIETIHIVESEKTAIICSLWYGRAYKHDIWLATGGKGHEKLISKSAHLFTGHRVVLHPDIDAAQAWNEEFKKLKSRGIDCKIDDTFVNLGISEKSKFDAADAICLFIAKGIAQPQESMNVVEENHTDNQKKGANTIVSEDITQKLLDPIKREHIKILAPLSFEDGIGFTKLKMLLCQGCKEEDRNKSWNDADKFIYDCVRSGALVRVSEDAHGNFYYSIAPDFRDYL